MGEEFSFLSLSYALTPAHSQRERELPTILDTRPNAISVVSPSTIRR